MDPMTARRSYSALGHYAAVNTTRPNYDLLVKHRVRRAIFPAGSDPKTDPPQLEIVSVVNGNARNVTAKAEVIISLGAMQTPLLLQRSGIGQPVRLEAAGIKVVADLPGVGYNYQDHCGYSIASSRTYSAP
jgi:choline dehydrogenase-like flavoprotein